MYVRASVLMVSFLLAFSGGAPADAAPKPGSCQCACKSGFTLSPDKKCVAPDTPIPPEEDTETPPAGDCGGEWKPANLTVFTSYPEEGSNECIEYSGCEYAGLFAGMDGKQTKEWVQTNNIAAVHSKDFDALKGKTLRIRQGDKQIDAKVLDMCSDSDCGGCCTQNAGAEGFLIDLEKNTAGRFGSTEGKVEFQVCP
jgi:hypothetical protein